MKLRVERVDFEDDITYEAGYEGKRFHVIFRESDCKDVGLNVKTEAYKYVNAIERITTLEARVEKVLELAQDLDMHTVHSSLGGCGYIGSNTPCSCGLVELRAKLKSYLQNKGG